MRFFNIIAFFVLFSCASITSVRETGSSYTDDQINQFCMIRSLALNQNKTQQQAEQITIQLLEHHSISEERFGIIVRSQILDSTIQMEANETAMLRDLMDKNTEISNENSQNESELIELNGMNPTLYYTMLQDYERSTNFQNRVYKTCQTS